jgi:hypothetical protein
MTVAVWLQLLLCLDRGALLLLLFRPAERRYLLRSNP